MKSMGYGLIATMTVLTVIILATTDLIQDFIPGLVWIGLIVVILGLIPIIGSFISLSGITKISPLIVLGLGLTMMFIGWVINFIGG